MRALAPGAPDALAAVSRGVQQVREAGSDRSERYNSSFLAAFPGFPAGPFLLAAAPPALSSFFFFFFCGGLLALLPRAASARSCARCSARASCALRSAAVVFTWSGRAGRGQPT